VLTLNGFPFQLRMVKALSYQKAAYTEDVEYEFNDVHRIMAILTISEASPATT